MVQRELAHRGALGLSDLRRPGPGKAVGQISEAIPGSAQVLLHFDIYVLRKEEMPAAYFPHDGGLTLSEIMELVGALLRDPRIRIIEVAEYATLRDLDRSYVSKLVDLLAKGLRS